MGKGNYLTQLDKECVKAYADHDMSETGAANALYMHPNTMTYHLNKVKKLTGVNPKRFYELIELLKMWGEEV